MCSALGFFSPGAGGGAEDGVQAQLHGHPRDLGSDSRATGAPTATRWYRDGKDPPATEGVQVRVPTEVQGLSRSGQLGGVES
jgi:hypothetical protein